MSPTPRACLLALLLARCANATSPPAGEADASPRDAGSGENQSTDVPGTPRDAPAIDAPELPRDVPMIDAPELPRDVTVIDAPTPRDVTVIDAPAPRDVPAEDVAVARPPGITIGFWCGVPERFLNAQRVGEIAEAGFTLVNAPCEATSPGYNRRALDLAAAAGLDVIVSDPRLSLAAVGTDVTANVRSVVDELSGHPALLGYHLFDEPGTSRFATLAAAVAALRAQDPRRLGYINLFPDYASPAQLGAPSYDEYVRRFIAEVSPPVVSYDHYNFLLGGADGPSFFANLDVVRARSLERGLPFWQYIQSISYVGHRATTGPEKRWAALHTLAYGGTGVLYFTYWTPPQTAEQFGEGILTREGARTAQFAEVQSINRELAAMGRHLIHATSTAVFHNGPLARGTAPRTPGAPVYIPGPAEVTVGLFRAGSDAYALLVNRDYRAPVETDVWVATADGAPTRLDVASGQFSALPVLAREGASARVRVALSAGGGALLRLRGPVPRGIEGAEAFIGTVRADAGALDVVDGRFGAQRLRAAGWDDCPAGYRVVGRDFQSNGFWLCAREDLASRTFYVGNVVRDAGYYHRVSGGSATRVGFQGWDHCAAGRLLGRRFESNGFWLCME